MLSLSISVYLIAQGFAKSQQHHTHFTHTHHTHFAHTSNHRRHIRLDAPHRESRSLTHTPSCFVLVLDPFILYHNRLVCINLILTTPRRFFTAPMVQLACHCATYLITSIESVFHSWTLLDLTNGNNMPGGPL